MGTPEAEYFPPQPALGALFAAAEIARLSVSDGSERAPHGGYKAFTSLSLRLKDLRYKTNKWG